MLREVTKTEIWWKNWPLWINTQTHQWASSLTVWLIDQHYSQTLQTSAAVIELRRVHEGLCIASSEGFCQSDPSQYSHSLNNTHTYFPESQQTRLEKICQVYSYWSLDQKDKYNIVSVHNYNQVILNICNVVVYGVFFIWVVWGHFNQSINQLNFFFI